jgi:hypothetical protein
MQWFLSEFTLGSQKRHQVKIKYQASELHVPTHFKAI